MDSRIKKLVATVALAGAVTVGTAGTRRRPKPAAARPMRRPRPASVTLACGVRSGGAAIKVVTDTLGVSRHDLRAALEGGQSVGEYAASLDQDPKTVSDALINARDHQARRAGRRRQAPAGPRRHHQGQGPGPGRHVRESSLRAAGTRPGTELTRTSVRGARRSPARRAPPRLLSYWRVTYQGDARWPISRSTSTRTSSRSRSGSTTSPKTSSVRRPRVGTSAKRPPGRSSRRRRRSASTPWSSGHRATMVTPPASTWPVVMEEMCWGDAGITLAIFGSTLAVSGISRQRHARADRGVGAAGATAPPEKGPARQAFWWAAAGCGERRQLALRTRAVYDEAKDEWVLNGTKTWITNGGIADVHVVVASVDPELAGRGQASFRGATRNAGTAAWARSSRSTASEPQPHCGGRCSTTCASRAACLLGGKAKLDDRVPRCREGTQQPRPGHAEDVRGDSAPWSAHRPIGIAARRLEYSLDYTEGARAVRPPDHREPGHRVQARRHEDRDRHGADSRVASVVNRPRPASRSKFGEGSMSKLKAGETAVRVTEDAIQILGGYGYVP